MDADSLSAAVTQLGFGTVAGFVVGYTAKKIVRLLIISLGLFYVALQSLAFQGLMMINYEKIQHAFEFWAGKMFEQPIIPGFIAA